MQTTHGAFTKIFLKPFRSAILGLSFTCLLYTSNCYFCIAKHGGLSEWFMVLVSKTSRLKGPTGSNPVSSAKFTAAKGLGFCVLGFRCESTGVSVSPIAAASRADAYSVRCVKE